jgi:hypothetical protein
MAFAPTLALPAPVDNSITLVSSPTQVATEGISTFQSPVKGNQWVAMKDGAHAIHGDKDKAVAKLVAKLQRKEALDAVLNDVNPALAYVVTAISKRNTQRAKVAAKKLRKKTPPPRQEITQASAFADAGPIGGLSTSAAREMTENKIITYSTAVQGYVMALSDDLVPAPEPSTLVPEPVPANWPKPMGSDAYYGVTGDFVHLVSPESEADPNALLLCFLIGMGAMVGRKPHFLTEATKQAVNEFAVIVGDTGKARKTTATDRVIDVLTQVDADFMEGQICRGLATGEGLIYRIRDPHLEGTTLDPGVSDKRLLCIETEFSSVLRSIRGNKLSEDLRKAFDGNPLERRLRRNPYGCKHPHIGIIGNTTIDELKGLLKSSDKANGFGNRFLWCCARRFQLKALGGNPLDQSRMGSLVSTIQRALRSAQVSGRITFDAPTGKAWVHEHYPRLTRALPGFPGAMQSRAETHVIRLATLYAFLDECPAIQSQHLSAAMEVWRYCAESVTCLFGDVPGNDMADRILLILRANPAGLTQTEINRGAFQSNKPAAEMARALALLMDTKLVRSENVKTSGRPATVWYANI